MDDCAESQHDHVRLRKIGKLSAAIFAPFAVKNQPTLASPVSVAGVLL
jgi:hypothetical protein